MSLTATGRLYSACVNSVMLYGKGTWLVKDENKIRLEWDLKMVRWACNVRPEYRISAEELRTKLKLDSIRECLLDKRLKWLGYLERMEENACFSKLVKEQDLGKYGRRQSKMI